MKSLKIAIYFFGVMFANAQQIPPIANFFNNEQVFNPASVGSLETEVNVSLLSRLQWAGIKGAPTSFFFWGDYKLKDNKSAIGLNVNSISYGITSIKTICGNYAYNLKLNKNLSLAMGLRLGVGMIRVNTLPADKIWDLDDPFVDAAATSTTIPSVGAGFRLKGKKFYLGLAAPDLLSSDKNDVFGNKSRGFWQKKHNYMLSSGYQFKLSNAYNLKTNALLYYMPSHNPRLDLNAVFEIRDYFWAGATYSTSKFHSLMVGTHISSTLKLAYAFQFSVGKAIPTQFYTHEISLLLNLDVLKK